MNIDRKAREAAQKDSREDLVLAQTATPARPSKQPQPQPQPPVERAPAPAAEAAPVRVRSLNDWTNSPEMAMALGAKPVQRKAESETTQKPQEDPSLLQQVGSGVAAAGQAVVNGAKATGQGIANAAQSVASRAQAVGQELATSQFNDLNASMYRVTMSGSKRIVEAIVRQTDPTGKVFYMATGLVTGFSGEKPIIEPYKPPKHLGDWTPRITHVNGMMATPEGGIGAAESLHQAIAEKLDGSIMPPDVLYTYSAKGGFFPDLIDSVKGKVGVDDAVIDSQETLILDAVRSGRRITMSAHSRGTIKTDVAVRNAHAVLREEMVSECLDSPEASKAAEEAMAMAQQLAAAGHPTVSPAIAAEIARRGAAKKIAVGRAWQRIASHVQLVYAGNAVVFPAPPAELVVGRSDFVSMTVGTYFQMGRDIKRFVKISGGHGFTDVYASTVGEWIAQDLTKGKPSS